MTDDDDYITVNITKDQTSALTFMLMEATNKGCLNNMPPELRYPFFSFLEMMMIEIDRQKLNALGNN
jgi:hypothetical protein